MRSQISSSTISNHPVDVSCRFTHHINHLIKTVSVHPVDGCGKIPEMVKKAALTAFLASQTPSFMGELGFREHRPGDVETGTITAEHRTDTAHVSISGKIHNTCSLPANI